MVKCRKEGINFINKEDFRQEIHGTVRLVKLRPITSTQLGKCISKGCEKYVLQVGYENSKDNILVIENMHTIEDFVDVFLNEISRLPPRRDIDFTIKLIPIATPVSKEKYYMSIPGLIKLKIRQQELLNKGSI